LERSVIAAISDPPKFIAVVGSFHGKSTGSLKLTFDPEYRKPWEKLGIQTVFVPREDIPVFEATIDRTRVTYSAIAYESDGQVRFEQRSFTNVAACFCEPVQGEGGIQVLSSEYMQAMRRLADSSGFPLIMDEIQCGMGRCGTFLASNQTGVRGDYYLLSKSLGGGLKDLSDRQRESLEVMTTAMINKLLHGPISHLKKNAEKEDDESALYSAALKKLFNIEGK
jgi:acetylornithine/succinyldiaminopimelate/putrescine aminotransferase